MTTKPVLQIILIGLLYREDEDKHNQENMGKNTIKQQNDRYYYISFNNNLKYEWSQFSIQKIKLACWIKKQDPTIVFLQEMYLIDKEKKTGLK
jgi:hypothetical protein